MRRARPTSAPLLLSLVVVLAAVTMACTKQTTTAVPAPSVTSSTSTSPPLTFPDGRTLPPELADIPSSISLPESAPAWCKTIADLPNQLGNLGALSLSGLPTVVANLKQARADAPEEVKPDLDTLLTLLQKAADAAKAGSLNDANMQDWMTQNFGVDGLTKIATAASHLESATTSCV